MPPQQLTPVESLLVEVDASVRQHPVARREKILRQITDLFIAVEPGLESEHQTLFGDVFHRLIYDLEVEPRAELSRRLAPTQHAPHALMRELAFDAEIRVAQPVIEFSPVLTLDDLMVLARVHGPLHLRALAGRATLSDATADVIVDRGDRGVLLALAGNAAFVLSQGLLGKLNTQAKGDDELQAMLRARQTKASADTPANDAPSAPRVDADLTAISAEMATLRAAGKLDIAVVRDRIRRGQYRHGMVALSVLLKLGPAANQRLLAADNTESLLLIARSSGLDWTTVRDLLRVEPANQDARLTAAYQSFSKMSPETASQIVSFWRVRNTAAA